MKITKYTNIENNHKYHCYDNAKADPCRTKSLCFICTSKLTSQTYVVTFKRYANEKVVKYTAYNEMRDGMQCNNTFPLRAPHTVKVEPPTRQARHCMP